MPSTGASDPFWHLVLIACLIGILGAIVAGGFWEWIGHLRSPQRSRTMGGRQ